MSNLKPWNNCIERALVSCLSILFNKALLLSHKDNIGGDFTEAESIIVVNFAAEFAVEVQWIVYHDKPFCTGKNLMMAHSKKSCPIFRHLIVLISQVQH